MRVLVLFPLLFIACCAAVCVVADEPKERGGGFVDPASDELFAEPGPRKSPGGKEATSTAFPVLRITCDPATGLADERLIEHLLFFSDVSRKAIEKVSAEAAKEPLAEVASIYGSTKVEHLNANQRFGVALLWLTVTSFDKRVDANKLLDAVGAALEARLRALDTGHAAQEKQLRVEEDRVQALAALFAKENALLHQLAAIQKVELDPALQTEKRIRIESELQGLKAQLVGLKARQGIIEKQVAQLGTVPANSQEDAAIVAELGKSIEARRRILAIGMTANTRNPGAVTAATIEKARDELAHAEVELARYRRAAADAAGGGRIAQLKSRLDDTAIEISELEARGKVLDEQLQAASSVSNQVMMKRIDLEQLEREYRQRSADVSDLRSQLDRYVPPNVTVISMSGPK